MRRASEQAWEIIHRDDTLSVDQKADVIVRLLLRALRNRNKKQFSDLVYHFCHSTIKEKDLRIQIISKLEKVELSDEQKIDLFTEALKYQDIDGFGHDAPDAFFILYIKSLIQDNLAELESKIDDWFKDNFEKKKHETPTIDMINRLINLLFKEFQKKSRPQLLLFKIVKAIESWRSQHKELHTSSHEIFLARWLFNKIPLYVLEKILFKMQGDKELHEMKEKHQKPIIQVDLFTRSALKKINECIELLPQLGDLDKLDDPKDVKMKKTVRAKKVPSKMETDFALVLSLKVNMSHYLKLKETDFSDALRYQQELKDNRELDTLTRKFMLALSSRHTRERSLSNGDIPINQGPLLPLPQPKPHKIEEKLRRTKQLGESPIKEHEPPIKDQEPLKSHKRQPSLAGDLAGEKPEKFKIHRVKSNRGSRFFVSSPQLTIPNPTDDDFSSKELSAASAALSALARMSTEDDSISFQTETPGKKPGTGENKERSVLTSPQLLFPASELELVLSKRRLSAALQAETETPERQRVVSVERSQPPQPSETTIIGTEPLDTTVGSSIAGRVKRFESMSQQQPLSSSPPLKTLSDRRPNQETASPTSVVTKGDADKEGTDLKK